MSYVDRAFIAKENALVRAFYLLQISSLSNINKLVTQAVAHPQYSLMTPHLDRHPEIFQEIRSTQSGVDL